MLGQGQFITRETRNEQLFLKLILNNCIRSHDFLLFTYEIFLRVHSKRSVDLQRRFHPHSFRKLPLKLLVGLQTEWLIHVFERACNRNKRSRVETSYSCVDRNIIFHTLVLAYKNIIIKGI